MFECKVCSEKDLRIESLEKHIETLSKLVFPSKQEPRQAFIDSLEANKILDGDSSQIELTEDSEAVHAEAESIFTGTYSDDF